MTFADFEEKIRDELDRMLGPGGFASARGVAAIAVNRRPHGCGHVANSLYDEDDYERVLVRAAALPPRRHRQFRCRQRRLCPISRSTRRRARCRSLWAEYSSGRTPRHVAPS
jgi:hypothetical protein